jgi:hypothetical protein
MRISRTLSEVKPVWVILVLAATAALSAWGLVHNLGSKIDRLWTHVADTYDEYLPEIKIQQGKASIRKQQPYRVPGLVGQNFVAVIDTRPGRERDALQYLAEAPGAAVLTRDSVWIKNNRRTQSFPLREFPDMEVDSAAIASWKDDYFSVIMRIMSVFAGFYFLGAKTLQAFLFALIPFFVTRSSPLPPSYGRILKIAVFALAPVSLMDLLMGMIGVSFSSGFALYFLLYGAILVLASVDLRNERRDQRESFPETTA